MKTLTLFSLAFTLWYSLLAQAPQSFSYQSVARDGTGTILANKSVSFRISILSGSVSGTTVYSETHNGKTTNSFGMVNLEIGRGSVVSGIFSSISWSSNTYFIKVEMDPNSGTAYQVMGTSQLLSVPYALNARSAESVSGGASPTGTAGGDLSGTYPNPAIGDGKVTSAKIMDGTVISSDLADNSVNNAKIVDTAVSTNKLANNAVTSSKLASMGASAAGQVLKWSGSAWEPGTDQTGSGGGIPGGSSGHIQFNNGGSFGGDANLFWDNTYKRLGVGTTTPGSLLDLKFNSDANYPHLLMTENGSDYSRVMFKNTGSPTKNWTIAGLAGSPDANSRLNFYYHNGTYGKDIMVITGDGKVGIGNTSPQANLQTEGTVIFGSGGVAFTEIREITGTLTNPSITVISYPSGYNQTNTRILSMEFYNSVQGYWFRLPFVDNSNYCAILISTTAIMLTFSPEFTGFPYRMILMKVQ